MNSDALKKFRQEFSLASPHIALNNAGLAPLPFRSQAKVSELLTLHSTQGSMAVETLFREYAHAREIFAQFVGLRPLELAFTPNTASALSYVALGYNKFTAGDEILQLDQEYPSNAYPWMEATKKFDLMRVVLKSNDDFTIDWSKFLEAINPRTKIVALSWVQYQTGESAPLKEISARCKKFGSLLVVDGIQGLGVMPFAMRDSGVDIICGGTHKWMCGPLGLGFLGVREEILQDFDPIVFGAMTFGTHMDRVDAQKVPHPDYRKFEPGVVPAPTAAGAAVSLEIMMECGIKNIHTQAMKVSHVLREELLAQGMKVLTSAKSESPIVCFQSPQAAQISAELTQRHVHHTLREDRIRLAPHGFNTIEEAKTAVAKL